MSDRFEHTLEHKLERNGDGSGDRVAHVRRFEVITGIGRRRRWSADEKARILVESFAPGANVSEVARRNGLTPQQLFGWRRELRASEVNGSVSAQTPEPPARTRSMRPASSELEFAPIVVASAPPPPPAEPSASSMIEITICDVVLRVVGKVETEALAAVLRAVRRSA